MYFFSIVFDTDRYGGLHFNPNGKKIDKEKLWKAKDELERFLRDTTDSELYLFNLEADKNQEV